MISIELKASPPVRAVRIEVEEDQDGGRRRIWLRIGEVLLEDGVHWRAVALTPDQARTIGEGLLRLVEHVP